MRLLAHVVAAEKRLPLGAQAATITAMRATPVDNFMGLVGPIVGRRRPARFTPPTFRFDRRSPHTAPDLGGAEGSHGEQLKRTRWSKVVRFAKNADARAGATPCEKTFMQRRGTAAQDEARHRRTRKVGKRRHKQIKRKRIHRNARHGKTDQGNAE